ncbi:MAG: FadR family transcriptional regulator [Rhizobiales bacterium]|nr:FadR family transcriptional regulator [Hyphomicrobiales bacterium]
MNVPKSYRLSLTKKIETLLRQKVVNKDWVPGDKLPTEHALANEHGVSRTVIREAISGLKADGLLASRQGSGIFVIEPQEQPIRFKFLSPDPSILSSVIESLELRTAVEIGSAELAAARCSPAQEEEIYARFSDFRRKILVGEVSEKEDFAFHVAIAEASNNKKFVEFLTIIGRNIIPRSELRIKANLQLDTNVEKKILLEHEKIFNAIVDKDAEAAGKAMRVHLSDGAERYRKLARLARN